MQYHPDVIHYFENSTHACSLPPAADVVTAKQGSIALGEMLQLQLQVSAGVIQQAAFKAYGAPHLIAGAQWLCEQLQSKTLQQASAITYRDVIARFTISKVKQHSALLIEDVLLAALAQCQQEQLSCQPA